MSKKIMIGLLVLLVGIQFIRPARNNGNASGTNDITHVIPVPDTILSILQTSCYDCHSNKTYYPWYTGVNPVGWWMNHHVNEGKAELNFSECVTYSKKKMDHKLDELIEQVQEREMPLSSYTLIHQNAKLDTAQAAMLIQWAQTARLLLGVEKEVR